MVVLLAFCALVGVLYKTGDLSVGKRGYVLRTRLVSAQGVKQFAPVRLSGVEVGEVRDLDFLYEADQTLIEARLWLQEEVRVRKDAVAVVNMLGLMGEKYVEIKAGSSTDFAKPGDLINSKEAVTTDELMEMFKEVGEDLKLALGDFREVFKNVDGILDENKPKFSRIMDNLEETTEYFKEFAEDVKHHPWKVLAKGKEKTPEELAKLRAERKARKLREAGEEIPPELQVQLEEKTSGKKKRSARSNISNFAR